MKKVLFDNEVILATWADCTLTNRRVWRYIEAGGQSEYKGFPLSQFQGAVVGRTSKPWLLYIGVLMCLLALPAAFANRESIGVVVSSLLIGGVFILAWHLTKRAQVRFSSTKVKIEVLLHANAQDFDAAVAFVADIEKAATVNLSKSSFAA